MLRFGLIRHAQTEWNREKRIQGQNDTPLTIRGEQQARKWGRLLTAQPWDRMIVSDAGRAVSTAGLINDALQIPMAIDARLREQNWGLWTGKTVSRIEQEDPRLFKKQIAAGWKFCPPNGEDLNSVWERSQRALRAAAARWPGETILVIAHQGVIKCLIYRLLGRQFVQSEPPVLKSPYLHWLVHDPNGLRIEEINELKLA